MNLEEIRTTSRILGEKRYVALETLQGLTNWINETKPSNLVSKENEMDEQTARNFWTKWLDQVEKIYFGKAAEIPELLVNDVINLFKTTTKKEPINAK